MLRLPGDRDEGAECLPGLWGAGQAEHHRRLQHGPDSLQDGPVQPHPEGLLYLL